MYETRRSCPTRIGSVEPPAPAALPTYQWRHLESDAPNQGMSCASRQFLQREQPDRTTVRRCSSRIGRGSLRETPAATCWIRSIWCWSSCVGPAGTTSSSWSSATAKWPLCCGSANSASSARVTSDSPGSAAPQSKWRSCADPGRSTAQLQVEPARLFSDDATRHCLNQTVIFALV